VEANAIVCKNASVSEILTHMCVSECHCIRVSERMLVCRSVSACSNSPPPPLATSHICTYSSLCASAPVTDIPVEFRYELLALSRLEKHNKTKMDNIIVAHEPSGLLPWDVAMRREVGGWGRVPFSRNLMSPTPRRKWYLTTGRRAH